MSKRTGTTWFIALAVVFLVVLYVATLNRSTNRKDHGSIGLTVVAAVN
jgi:hypothetical protein